MSDTRRDAHMQRICAKSSVGALRCSEPNVDSISQELTPTPIGRTAGNGDADASDATFGFYFKGFEIIMATIRDLVATHGMGSTAGGRLLFGGCSAGGIGAMNALDTVASMVPAGLKARRRTPHLRSRSRC